MTCLQSSDRLLCTKFVFYSSFKLYLPNNIYSRLIKLHYSIRRFKAGVAKEYMREILREELSGVLYNPEEIPTLSRSLADTIKNKLKGKRHIHM